MATYAKQLLSGSTNGKPVKVVQTASTGTTIHTAVSGTTDFDEVWLWAFNIDTTARKLTVEYGGTTDCTVEVTIPAEGGAVLVIPGWLLNNSLVVTAFAATANVVFIDGYVNRITA